MPHLIAIDDQLDSLQRLASAIAPLVFKVEPFRVSERWKFAGAAFQWAKRVAQEAPDIVVLDLKLHRDHKRDFADFVHYFGRQWELEQQLLRQQRGPAASLKRYDLILWSAFMREGETRKLLTRHTADLFRMGASSVRAVPKFHFVPLPLGPVPNVDRVNFYDPVAGSYA